MSGVRDPDILNIEEAAQLLGVSVKTFNKVLHTQDLPARKIGREWKFSRQALIDWVGSGRSSQFYKDVQGDDSADSSVITPAQRVELREPADASSASETATRDGAHRRN